MPRLSRRQALGAALVCLSVLAPLGRHLAVRWSPPLDLRVPLATTASGVAREVFTVDESGPYDLRVAAARPHEREAQLRAECLLGFDWTECAGEAPAVQVRWHLQADAGDVRGCDDGPGAEGTGVHRGVGGSLMPGEMQRRVGCFDARAGTRYRLEVETLADLAAAEALQPRFVVAPSVALAREGLSLTGMVWLGALIAALAGGAMLLW